MCPLWAVPACSHLNKDRETTPRGCERPVREAVEAMDMSVSQPVGLSDECSTRRNQAVEKNLKCSIEGEDHCMEWPHLSGRGLVADGRSNVVAKTVLDAQFSQGARFPPRDGPLLERQITHLMQHAPSIGHFRPTSGGLRFRPAIQQTYRLFRMNSWFFLWIQYWVTDP